jgi:hypothetical protein
MANTINADNGVVSGSAGLKESADSTGVLALQTNGTTAVSISTGQVVTLTNALAQDSGGTGTTVGYNGFKNRIINGAMVIDQRNAGAEVNPAVTGIYYLDRWVTGSTAASKFKIGQNAGSITPPAGFINYLGCTSLSAYTVGASEIFIVQQRIEGFNIADLAWGTASAATVTLSFWVLSSLTGTFGGSLRNSAGNRSYPFSYTISSANTWEQKTVTIAGDTSGTWLTTNGNGISIAFALGTGATLSTTAGAWAAGNYVSATGATSVVGTNGATFYITGVQLEKGSTATSFDYRPYGTELALCQRYCFTLISNGQNASSFIGVWRPAVSGVEIGINFPVTMRSSPSGSVPAGNNSWGLSDGLNPYTGTPTTHAASPYSIILRIPASTPTFASGYATIGLMYAASGTVCLLASAEL